MQNLTSRQVAMIATALDDYFQMWLDINTEMCKAGLTLKETKHSIDNMKEIADLNKLIKTSKTITIK